MNRYSFVDGSKSLEKSKVEFIIGAVWQLKKRPNDKSWHYSMPDRLVLHNCTTTKDGTFWYTSADQMNAIDERILRENYEPL